eukprot:SAG31_NODE_7257_length_1740_cov_4.884826_2_plen_98_part_00
MDTLNSVLAPEADDGEFQLRDYLYAKLWSELMIPATAIVGQSQSTLMEKWITEEQEGRTSSIPWVQTDAENQETANKIFIVLEAFEEMLTSIVPAAP